MFKKLKYLKEFGYKKNHFNIIPFISCYLLSIVYFFTLNAWGGGVRNVFNYDSFLNKVKIILLILVDIFILSLILYSIYYFYKNRKKHKKFLKHFFIYFFIMLIFLILLWPGIFKGDEFYTLSNVTDLKITYTQHYITCIFICFHFVLYQLFGELRFSKY